VPGTPAAAASRRHTQQHLSKGSLLPPPSNTQRCAHLSSAAVLC
jgi:hypothetical protein